MQSESSVMEAEFTPTFSHLAKNTPLVSVGSLAVPRIVLFDDDPLFVRAMERMARRHSIPLISVGRMEDIANVVGKDFDLAILDFDLGDVTGVELAEVLEDTVGRIPMVMISYTERQPTSAQPWPNSVKRFVLKDVGPASIIDGALEVFRWNTRRHL